MSSRLNQQKDRQKGIVALIFLAFVFACMGLFARFLASGFHLIQQVYLRVLVAFVLALFVFGKDLDFSKLKKISSMEWLLLLFRSLAQYTVGVVLFTQSIILTKYSNVSFIGALPFTAVFGFLLVSEKFTWPKMFFIVTAFLGVTLIAVKDYSHIFSWGFGEILAFISAAFFALGYVTRRWHTGLLNNKEITILLLFLAVVMLIPISFLLGEPLPIHGWTNALVLAVFGAGLFNLTNLSLINYGFQNVEAVLASNILTLESTFAIILGFLFYQEFPTLKEFLGGLLIIGSVIKMNQIESRE